MRRGPSLGLALPAEHTPCLQSACEEAVRRGPSLGLALPPSRFGLLQSLTVFSDSAIWGFGMLFSCVA